MDVSALEKAFGLHAPDFTAPLPAVRRADDSLDPEVAFVLDRLPEIHSAAKRVAYGRERLCDLLYHAPTPLAFLQTTQAMQIVERHAEVVLSRPRRRPPSLLELIGESLAMAVLSILP